MSVTNTFFYETPLIELNWKVSFLQLIPCDENFAAATNLATSFKVFTLFTKKVDGDNESFRK